MSCKICGSYAHEMTTAGCPASPPSFTAASCGPMMPSDEQVERVAATLHGIYQAEAKRQGDVRHHDDYSALPEHIKEFDRVLARWHLAERDRMAERVKVAADDNAILLKLITESVAKFEAIAMPTSELQHDLNDIVEELGTVKYQPHPGTAITHWLAEMEEALRLILTEPYGCPQCDSGKLRDPEKQHWEECGFAKAKQALDGE